MQNIKYHALNTAAALFASFMMALTASNIYRFVAAPAVVPNQPHRQSARPVRPRASFSDYRPIIDSTFFKVAQPISVSSGAPAQAAPAVSESELVLLGTISGPPEISRALIKKKSEPEAKVYGMWKDVFGYKIVRITESKVHLRIGKEIRILDMYADQQKEQQKPGTQVATASQSSNLKQNISRSELQQKVLKNIDNALQGVRAGPYRVDGKIEGYKIFRIRPYNVLYKLGARPGDIIKRINNNPVNSTEKLYQIWESVKTDSRITVDLDRGGQMLKYEFNITD
jgi:general secretion pathway protein C